MMLVNNYKLKIRTKNLNKNMEIIIEKRIIQIEN